MENDNRRIAWVGGILILGVAVLLGWLVLSRKEKEPEVSTTPRSMIEDTLKTVEPEPADPGPATQPPPQVVVDAEGKYTVQVSSWQTPRRAERDAERFNAKGFTAYVQSADIPEKGGTWYRVRVGSYATNNEAQKMAAQLAGLLESGFWVARYRKP